MTGSKIVGFPFWPVSSPTLDFCLRFSPLCPCGSSLQFNWKKRLVTLEHLQHSYACAMSHCSCSIHSWVRLLMAPLPSPCRAPSGTRKARAGRKLPGQDQCDLLHLYCKRTKLPYVLHLYNSLKSVILENPC